MQENWINTAITTFVALKVTVVRLIVEPVSADMSINHITKSNKAGTVVKKKKNKTRFSTHVKSPLINIIQT